MIEPDESGLPVMNSVLFTTPNREVCFIQLSGILNIHQTSAGQYGGWLTGAV